MAFRKRKSREGGKIYQVDLIAALFAGYTIVWIATSDKQEILEAQTELKLASLRASITGKLQVGKSQIYDYLQRAGVQGISEEACVPDTFEPFIDTSKINWQSCRLNGKPVQLNKYNDALSIMEVKEACGKSWPALRDEKATSYDSVLDASLLDIALPSGLALVGLGYGQSEENWPPLPFEDKIPKYIGLDFSSKFLWKPERDPHPYKCSYDRDRERHLEALYVAEGFDQSQSRVTISVNDKKGSDLFHVYSDTSVDAVSFISRETYDILESGSLKIQQDFNLKNPKLSLRLCLHEDGTAVCWSGDGDLVSGASYSLNKEL